MIPRTRVGNARVPQASAEYHRELSQVTSLFCLFLERAHERVFSLQQFATRGLRDCAFLRQIHKTVETIGSRCSHAAFVRICAFVAQANNVFVNRRSPVQSRPLAPLSPPRDRTAPPLHSAHVAAPFRQPGFVTPQNRMVRPKRR